MAFFLHADLSTVAVADIAAVAAVVAVADFAASNHVPHRPF